MVHLRSLNLVSWAMAVILAGAVIGVLTALALPNDRSVTVPSAQAHVVYAPDGPILTVVQEADQRVLFPPALSELGAPVEKLAIDESGQIWIPAFSGFDSGHVLFRYDIASGSIEQFKLPDEPGSALSSGVGISSTGKVVLAYGGIVAAMNPASGEFTIYELPRESPNYNDFGIPESMLVTDMALDSNDVAYVTRENVAAVTTIDLNTGETSEIRVEGVTGNLFDVEVIDQDVYVANWVHGGDIYDGSTGGTRLVKLSPRGEQQVLAGSAWALAEGANSLYSVDLKGEVRAFLDGSLFEMTDQVPGAAIEGRIRVDARSHDVWISGREADTITQLQTDSMSMTPYKLPVYEGLNFGCSASAQCDLALRPTVHTGVGAMATAPNGDLYFTDATMQRIGVIHPSD